MSEGNRPTPSKGAIMRWIRLFESSEISIGEYQTEMRGHVLPSYEEYRNEFYPKNLGEILRYLPIERVRDFDDVLGPKDNEGNEYSWKSVFKVARRLKRRRWRIYYWCRYHAISVNLPAIILAALVGATLVRLLG